MVNNLFILTTAVIRPDIHKKGIAHFINLINSSKIILKNFKNINFIINLDNIGKKDSKENIKLLKTYSKNTKINIYENKKNPCFLNAFINVYLKCNEIQNSNENNIFFWLEDDWYITKDNFNNYLKKEIISFINDDNQYLMTVNWKPSGPPFFFKQFYFDKLIYHIQNNLDKNKNDPERIMNHLWKKVNVLGPNKRKQIGVRLYKNEHDYQYPILFTDTGKDWASKNNLKKWDKKLESNKLSYEKIK